MFSLLVLAFLYVLLVGTTKAPPSGQAGHTPQEYAKVTPGTSKLLRFDGQPAWVTHIDIELLGKLKSLENVISNQGCSPTLGFCILSASTSTAGVLITFTEAAPAQIPADIQWVGGFVDPTNGNTYDQLGRPYKINSSNSSPKIILQTP